MRAMTITITISSGGKALSTEVSTQDVLKVAAAFERWLLGQER
jgi:hypothetical protein